MRNNRLKHSNGLLFFTDKSLESFKSFSNGDPEPPSDVQTEATHQYIQI